MSYKDEMNFRLLKRSVAIIFTSLLIIGAVVHFFVVM